MGQDVINATRMEFNKNKKRLETGTKGYQLLKDKRDELMRQFMEEIRQDIALWNVFTEQFQLLDAMYEERKGNIWKEELFTAMMLPQKTQNIEKITKMRMGIEMVQYRYEKKSFEYYIAYVSLHHQKELDQWLEQLVKVWDVMMELVNCEKRCQVMAQEIERTRRRVNALEHRIIPQAKENMKRIRMKLDELERGSQIRLMKRKQQMAEDDKLCYNEST